MSIDAEKIIREYIPDILHMSLATVKDNAPWVCEVHFAYDDDLNLYFRSLASRRHSQEIAENPKVAGNIVKQFALGESPVGVYFEGAAEMLEPGETQSKAAVCIADRLKKAAADTIAEAARDDGHKFYKITVDTFYVFGRFAGPSGQKVALKWRGSKK